MNTPLPLRIGVSGQSVIAANGRVVADCGNAVDAQRIVTTHNAHNDLIDALKQLMQLTARLAGSVTSDEVTA